MGWLEDNGLYNAIKLLSQGDGGTVEDADADWRRRVDRVGTAEHSELANPDLPAEERLRLSDEPDAGYELNPDGSPRFAEGETPDIARANTRGMTAYDEDGMRIRSPDTDVYVSAREAPGDRVASRRMSESDSGPAGGNRYSFGWMQADPEERRGIREAADWWDDSVTGAADAVGGVLRELPGGDPEHTETLWGRGLIEDAARLPARALESAGRGYSHEAVMGGHNSQYAEAAEVADIDTGRLGEGTENMMVEARRRGDTGEIIAGQILPWAMSGPIMEAAGAASGLTQIPKLARAVGVAGDATAGYLGGRGYAQGQFGEDEHREGLIDGALGGALGWLARYGLAGVGGRVNSVTRAQKAPKLIPEEIPQRMLGGDFGAPPRQGPLQRMAPMEGPGIGEYLQHGPAPLRNAQQAYGHLDVPQPQGRARAIGSADTGIAPDSAVSEPASGLRARLNSLPHANPEQAAADAAIRAARPPRAPRPPGELDEMRAMWAARDGLPPSMGPAQAPPAGIAADDLSSRGLGPGGAPARPRPAAGPAGDAFQQASPRHQEMLARIAERDAEMAQVMERAQARVGDGIVQGQGRGMGGQRMDAPIAPDDLLESLPGDAYRMDPPPLPPRGADRAYDPRFDYHGVPDALPEVPSPEQARAMAAGLPDARPLPEVPSEEALGARGRGSLLDEYIDGPPPPAADVPPMAPAADEMRIGALETGEMAPIPEGLPGLADDYDARVNNPLFDRMERPQPQIEGEMRRDARARERNLGQNFENLAAADQPEVMRIREAGGGELGFESMASRHGVERPPGPRLVEFAQAWEDAAATPGVNPRRSAINRVNRAMRAEFPEWWAAGGNEFTQSWRGGGAAGGRRVADIKPLRADRARDVNQMGPDPEVAMDIMRRMRDRGRQAAGNLEMPGMPDMRRLQIPEGAPPETALGRVMERYGDGMKRKGIHAMTYAAPAAAATGHPQAAAGFLGAGAAMWGSPKIVRVLDNMITRGRYGNIGPLTALRDALRAGRGQEMRGVIAAHTAMLEDPEFRQAFRAAEGEIAGGGDDDGYQWHDDAANAATPTSEGGPADADAYEWH